jgi:ABC-type transport system involved in multi-copper enzyme maturation permease subunit
MREILVVTRKEFREQLRQRRDVLRYIWFAVVFGGLFPLSSMGQGHEALVVGSLPWLAYAGIVTASGTTVGAFFLERQRGTLETLLATPLSDLAIFAGKVIFSLFISLLSVFAAVAVELLAVNVALLAAPHSLRGASVPFNLPPLVYFALFVTGPLFLVYVIGAGTLISLRVRSIRTANLLGLLSTLPLAVPVGLVALVARPGLNWGFVVALTGVMVVVDAVALRLALGLFSRETVVLNIPS